MLGRARALTLDASSELTSDDRGELERERGALFLWAEALSVRTRSPLSVAANSSVADLYAFIDAALAVDIARAERVTRCVFGGKLSAADRRRLHTTFKGFHHLSASDLLDAHSRGYRGVRAVRHALQSSWGISSPAVLTAPPRTPRAREQASRSGRSRTRNDDPELPPPPRGGLLDGLTPRQLADVRHWLARRREAKAEGRQHCSSCDRLLPVDEFPRAHRWCSACKNLDDARRRAARKAVAA